MEEESASTTIRNLAEAIERLQKNDGRFNNGSEIQELKRVLWEVTQATWPKAVPHGR